MDSDDGVPMVIWTISYLQCVAKLVSSVAGVCVCEVIVLNRVYRITTWVTFYIAPTLSSIVWTCNLGNPNLLVRSCPYIKRIRFESLLR